MTWALEVTWTGIGSGSWWRLPGRSTGDALDCEDMLYVASVAYQARTGTELDRGQVGVDLAGAARPHGTHWDFEDHDEIRRRLRRLWARLG